MLAPARVGLEETVAIEMDGEESIYSLIPKEYVPPPKPKRYRSKFPAETTPTASTFAKVVNNVQGDYQHFDGPHRSKSLSASFGQPKGAAKPDPQTFSKKGTGTMKLPEVQKFTRAVPKKPPVPQKTERPIMGLKTEKNYVVANAVEVILQPPKTLPEPENPLAKKNYGAVPKYLNTIKQEIDQEYETLQQLHREAEEENEKKRYLLPAEEVKQLQDGLKKKWDAVNKEYQTVTHISKVDTQGLKRKKESCEQQLAQIEKDLAVLSKPYVFIDSTS